VADPDRWAWAEVSLGAIAANTRALRAAAGVPVWTVVKANGYGHGAVRAAHAALSAGAEALCVALVDEGVELRDAGIDARILVLSEPPIGALRRAHAHQLDVTLYRAEAIEAAAAVGSASSPLAVHLKLDTGMQRVGADPGDVIERASAIGRAPGLSLESVWTHLACADEPLRSVTDEQLDRFDDALAQLEHAGIEVPLTHAANSAGALAHPRARRELVRVGIATYGIEPGPGVADLSHALQPAMAVKARVSLVKRVAAGSAVSYGHAHRFDHDTVVATLPLGYADGVPRRLFHTGGSVLVSGQRCPIVGVVTMDQMMVDVGAVADSVQVGDEAVLIGSDGHGNRILATEWADRLGTIGYEIVCGISPRIHRHEVA
jgi:alanine racemase